jgi:hypothetical protein
MSQPIWITPAGSLGSIPEGVFYQNTMLVTTDALPFAPDCTATTTGTNVITCASTTGIYAGLTVVFSGTTFGGIDPATRYYVLNVVNDTQFRITTTDASTTPVALTTATGTMSTVFRQDIYYAVIAGQLPAGIQCSSNGTIVGVPDSLASLQGVPLDVTRSVTSKFTLRAYTENQDETIDRIRDRTFTITVINVNAPVFASASNLGTYYDGDRLDIQIAIDNVGPTAPAVVTLVGGELPGEVSVSATGLISGYIQPAVNVDQPPGYDLTPDDLYPYDFVTSAINKNYQFTLQVTDGVTIDLRTFNFYVYDRTTLNASTTQITADNSNITADEGTERRPFIVNSLPENLGTVRGDNYYAHQFIANDYDTPDLKYAISVNIGSGLPPSLAIDPNSGWYYGYIPDQGVTKIEYSFNVVAYQADFIGDSISCTATTFGTNIITCDSTSQIETGQPIVFTGTSFGGITASATQVYYVLAQVSATEFTITNNLSSTTAVPLTTAAGSLTANLIVASDTYPFTLTISGTANAEVVWFTPSDLGTIENGATSMLVISAENTGGRTLRYRLKPGASIAQLPYAYVPGVYNLLPQGLKLLDTGEISGRVTFNTFAVDLGSTTFDATQAVTRNVTIQETTFDSTFTFTVNAYAEDSQQVLYNVNAVTIDNGGSGYSSGTPPVLTFNTPVGASARAATVGVIETTSGAIISVAIDDGGSGYTLDDPAVLTQVPLPGTGSGADFTAVMRPIGTRDVVSVDKTFTVKVQRAYNQPYQNLLIEAMPPANDRATIAELLDNEEIFVPDYIYRIDDPYFGKSHRVIYEHAFGLAPDALETYVLSLYENHYWKNLVLGEISTAQALDPITGEVVYEVVYSKIIDDLVNAAGASVSKVVNLSYPIIDPADGSTQLTQVYPNSLINMRDQVIDVVGQISTKLPLWMTSKQTNGRVLGFTPAWVMCYTKPGRSQQIAYYVQTQFQGHLNAVDFKVDRYVLDRTLSRNWDTATQNWTPAPSLTTFDRYGSGQLPFVGFVELATRQAYADINNRTLDYIADLGGLDGQVSIVNGNTIIFVKQEYYDDYATPTDAWQDYTDLYGNDYSPETVGEYFDESYTIPGGDSYECTETDATTDYIKAESTVGMYINDPVWFSGVVFGGIDDNGTNGSTQIYYVTKVVNTTCTATVSGTNLITCADATYLSNGDVVWFTGTTFGGVNALDASNNIQQYYVVGLVGTTFGISLTSGGTAIALSTAAGTMTVNTSYFSVTANKDTAGDFLTGSTYTILSVGDTDFTAIGAASNTVGVSFVATGAGEGTGTAGIIQVLSTAAGSMTVNFGNTRMAVYTISVDPVTTLVTFEPTQLTAETQYVQIVRGQQYAGQQLYYPTSPVEGYTLIAWTNVPEATTTETTFDGGSMAFIQPVDMYNPSDRDDKYLVFPKANILV